MVPSLLVEPLVVDSGVGRAQIWHPRPGVVLTRVEGCVGMEHAEAIMKNVDEAARARPGQAIVIHDWLGIETYEMSVQTRMMAWGFTVTSSLGHVVIGVASPLVALAVRTANLALGNRIEVINNAEALHAIVRAVVAGADRSLDDSRVHRTQRPPSRKAS